MLGLNLNNVNKKEFRQFENFKGYDFAAWINFWLQLNANIIAQLAEPYSIIFYTGLFGCKINNIITVINLPHISVIFIFRIVQYYHDG